MATAGWTFEDAKQHYFIYLERVDATDLLYELRTTPICANSDVDQLATTFYRNLRATAHATTTPFFTAMMGAFNGRASSIQQLIEHMVTNRDRSVLKPTISLLNDPGAFIAHTLDALRVIHERNLMPAGFQSLLRQGTVMAWGAFETFCADLFRLLFTRNLGLLRTVANAQAGGTPWSDTPRRLLEWIEGQVTANLAPNNEAAFDSFKKLPSM
jgi:fluoride ion exporter CrcB/FEX